MIKERWTPLRVQAKWYSNSTALCWLKQIWILYFACPWRRCSCRWWRHWLGSCRSHVCPHLLLSSQHCHGMTLQAACQHPEAKTKTSLALEPTSMARGQSPLHQQLQNATEREIKMQCWLHKKKKNQSRHQKQQLPVSIQGNSAQKIGSKPHPVNTFKAQWRETR